MEGNSLTEFSVVENTYLQLLLHGNYNFLYDKRSVDANFNILVNDWSERNYEWRYLFL